VALDGPSPPISSPARRGLWARLLPLPPRPVLPGGTIGSVLAAARPAASAAELEQAATAAALGPVIDDRGWDADLGRSGQGISLGERQRLSLARALLTPAQLVVHDKPPAPI